MFKYNFNLLKNKQVKIGYLKDNVFHGKTGKLINSKIFEDKISFIFEDSQLDVDISTFNYSLIRRNLDTISIIYDENNRKLSGMIGFVMSDTYGFPIEITEELLLETGYILDLEGFKVMQELQKEKSRKSIKNKSAFS